MREPAFNVSIFSVCAELFADSLLSYSFSLSLACWRWRKDNEPNFQAEGSFFIVLFRESAGDDDSQRDCGIDTLKLYIESS